MNSMTDFYLRRIAEELSRLNETLERYTRKSSGHTFNLGQMLEAEKELYSKKETPK